MRRSLDSVATTRDPGRLGRLVARSTGVCTSFGYATGGTEPGASAATIGGPRRPSLAAARVGRRDPPNTWRARGSASWRRRRVIKRGASSHPRSRSEQRGSVLMLALGRQVSWLSANALTVAFPADVGAALGNAQSPSDLPVARRRVLLTDYSGATAAASHRFLTCCASGASHARHRFPAQQLPAEAGPVSGTGILRVNITPIAAI